MFAGMFDPSGLGADDMMDFLEEDSYAMADTPNRRPIGMSDTPNCRPMVVCDTPNRRPMVMSDISNPRPMVNSKLLRKYVGRRVTTVVKVLRMEGGNVVGELPDGAPIKVHRAPQHVAAQSMFVEVIGVVESNHSLRAQTCTGFGDDFGE